jgi:hypothetical protein
MDLAQWLSNAGEPVGVNKLLDQIAVCHPESFSRPPHWRWQLAQYYKQLSEHLPSVWLNKQPEGTLPKSGVELVDELIADGFLYSDDWVKKASLLIQQIDQKKKAITSWDELVTRLRTQPDSVYQAYCLWKEVGTPQTLWKPILESYLLTGIPYDHISRR